MKGRNRENPPDTQRQRRYGRKIRVVCLSNFHCFVLRVPLSHNNFLRYTRQVSDFFETTWAYIKRRSSIMSMGFMSGLTIMPKVGGLGLPRCTPIHMFLGAGKSCTMYLINVLQRIGNGGENGPPCRTAFLRLVYFKYSTAVTIGLRAFEYTPQGSSRVLQKIKKGT